MRLSRDANVLVMPAVHSASIATHLVQALGGATMIGPMLVGLEKSVQIAPLGASVSEIITAATFAAYEEGAVADGEPVPEPRVLTPPPPRVEAPVAPRPTTTSVPRTDI
jgi:malate dehydrogenase (oxaloacetate-decarboxylating)(NADP+)